MPLTQLLTDLTAAETAAQAFQAALAALETDLGTLPAALLAATPADADAINWCGLLTKAESIITLLTSAGVPIPAILTTIVTILGGLCPAPAGK